MPRALYSRIIWLNCILGFGLFASPLSAQTQLSKTTKAAHDVFLEGYARTNSKCESVDPPTITLDQPPQHGIVCLRRADVWLRKTVENNLAQCLRNKALGVHVIYLPRKGYTGPDQVRYTVQFPSKKHAVEFDLTVLPDAPQSPTAVPGDISAPIGDAPQMPGPIPVCAALVS